MSDGPLGNVPQQPGAGTFSNPVSPNGAIPTTTSGRLLDTTRNVNGAGMVKYNALLTYPDGSIGKALADAGLGSVAWGNISGSISAQADLVASFTAQTNALAAHTSNVTNPHNTTKAQVGLSQVDNTADVNKPISIPQQAGLDLKLPIFNPTAQGTLTVPPGTTLVRPIALQSSALLAAPVAHSLEYNNANLYLTVAGAVRYKLPNVDGAGVNSDILSLTGLTTPLSVAQGGTGGNSVSALQALVSPPVFQCRVDVISASILRLSRRTGSWVFVNGFFRQIPSAGVDLAPTGATVFTTYNIYAFWNGSALQLEYSTTARATDATYGHQVKSGDSTRTLVGKTYVQTGPAWDVSNLLLTTSYYNRYRRIALQSLATTTASLTFTTISPIVGTSTYALSWGEDATEADADVTEQTSATSLVVFNFVTVRNSAAATLITSPSGNYSQAPFAGFYSTQHAKVSGIIAESLGLNTAGAAYTETMIAAYQNGGGSYQVIAGSNTITTTMS